jgi:hypothetical protein
VAKGTNGLLRRERESENERGRVRMRVRMRVRVRERQKGGGARLETTPDVRNRGLHWEEKVGVSRE